MSSTWLSDISANRIKKSYLKDFLDISGNLIIRSANIKLNKCDISMTGNLLFTANSTVANNITVVGDISINNSMRLNNNNQINNMIVSQDTSTNNVTVVNDVSLVSNIRVVGNALFNSTLIGNSDISSNSKLYVNLDASVNNNLFIGGNCNVNNSITASNNVNTSSRLFVSNGDASLNTNVSVGQDTCFNILILNGNSIISNGITVSQDVSINNNLQTLNVNANANVCVGKFTIRNPTSSVSIDISGTDAIRIPAGLVRPTATGSSQYGYVRYNTSSKRFEGYGSNQWITIDGVYVDNNTNIDVSNNELLFTSNGVSILRMRNNGDISANGNLKIGKDTTLYGNADVISHNASATRLMIGNVSVDVSANHFNYLANIGGNALLTDSIVNVSNVRNVTLSGNLTVGGNFSVNGQTSLNSTNVSISDKFIGINRSGSARDSGLIINNTVNASFIGWKENINSFIVGTVQSVNPTNGNVTVTVGNIKGTVDGSLNIITDSTNNTRYPLLRDGTNSQRIKSHSNLTYNPSTNTITTGTFVGTLTGIASSSTKPNVINTTTTDSFLTFVQGTTGSLPVYTNTLLKMNGTTLTADISGAIGTAVQPQITTASNLITVGTITTGKWAASQINGSRIANGLILTTNIAASAITSNAIALNTITNARFADGGISSSIISGVIGISKFANSSITNSKFITIPSLTLGSSSVTLGNTMTTINSVTSITAKGNIVGGTITGSLYGNILTSTQSSITTLSGLTSITTSNVSFNGNVRASQGISQTGTLTLGSSSHTIQGNIRFSKLPTYSGSSNPTNAKQLVTRQYVNSVSSGSGNAPTYMTTNTDQTITATKKINKITIQNINPSYSDVSYNNSINGRYAIAKRSKSIYTDAQVANAISEWNVASTNTAFDYITWHQYTVLRFVGITQSTGATFSSADGAVWDTFSFNGNRILREIPEFGMFGVITSTTFTIRNFGGGFVHPPVAASISTGYNDFAYSAEIGRFCIVGNNKTNRSEIVSFPYGNVSITYSFNGDITLTNNWVSICWAPEVMKFCTVANSGNNRIAVSSDGATWTSIDTTNFNNNWTSICWAREIQLFCAVASSGTSRVVISRDGITWTPIVVPTSDWQSICWSREFGVFCAVANAGDADKLIMTSFNGSIWTIQTSAPYGLWKSVCWSPDRGQFCCVAPTGTNRIMLSALVGKAYFRLQTNLSNSYWDIAGPTTVNSTSNVLNLSYNEASKGYITPAVTTSSLLNFTGQHRCFIKNYSCADADQLIGLIVCANNNELIKMSGGVSKGNSAITINEALPLVSLCIKEKDKTCFGVVSNAEDQDTRQDHYGAFVAVIDKELGDTRFFINSIGEGAIWVTNKNGSLESGDYITSSSIPGYGQKQDTERLANYTVAKITMDCNFSPVTRPAKMIKKKTVVSYKSSIANATISDQSFNDLPESEQMMYTPITTSVNDLDEYDQIQWIDASEYESAYQIRYVLHTGQIITVDEYNFNINNGIASYIAAFVGCTYHCG